MERGHAVAALASLTLLTSAAPAAKVAAPGEGLICSAMLMVAAAEVGRRCAAGRDSEVQQELGRSIGRIDAFILRHSDITAADLSTFKRRQGGAALSNGEICSGDRLDLYQQFVKVGPATIRAETDRLVARPGKPTWGDCL